MYGIKWGQYIGSPAYAKPVVCWSDTFSTRVSRLVSYPNSNLFILPPNSTHVIVTRTRNRTMHIVWSAILSWSHVDDIIRIWDIKKGTMSGFKENMNFHKVQEIRFSHTSTHFACSSHLSPRLIPTIYSYLIIISPLCLEGRVLVVFFWQTHQIFSRYSGFLL